MTQVVDYVAGMTDRFAVRTHERLFGTPGMAGRAGELRRRGRALGSSSISTRSRRHSGGGKGSPK